MTENTDHASVDAAIENMRELIAPDGDWIPLSKREAVRIVLAELERVKRQRQALTTAMDSILLIVGVMEAAANYTPWENAGRVAGLLGDAVRHNASIADVANLAAQELRAKAAGS